LADGIGTDAVHDSWLSSQPVIGWKDKAPNVVLFRQPDCADPRPLGIDIDNFGGGSFVRQNEENFDLHSHAQRHTTKNQCSMTIDDNGLTITGVRPIKTLSHER
jgi:hypothetical protein